MKKLISVLLVMLICSTAASAFAAEPLEYRKIYNDVSVKVKPVDSCNAVLVVSQFKSGKLVNIDTISISRTDKTYIMPEITMEQGIDYEFFVYDNLNLKNKLYESVVVNTESENRMFLGNYFGIEFQEIE